MSKKLKRSAVALVLAATMVFSSQGVLTAFAVGENETSTAVDVSALEPILDKVETDVANESGNVNDDLLENVCEICGGVDGQHEEGCSANQQPENTCPVCGGVDGQHTEDCTANQQPDEGDSGETTCPVCGGVDGQHTEDCTANQQPDEGDSGETTCPECGGVDGQHEENCSLAQESDNTPSEEDVAAAKNVSDLIGALPEASTLDPETTDVEALTAQVKAAREAYDKLTDAQKALVEKAVLDKLVALEGALEALQNTNVAAEGDVAKVGGAYYSNIDDAIENAPENSTIELLLDDPDKTVEPTKTFYKSLTFTGTGTLKYDIYGWRYNGNLTFDGPNVSLNCTTTSNAQPANNGEVVEWGIMVLGGSLNFTNGAKGTFSFDSKISHTSRVTTCAIFMNKDSEINITNQSSLKILGTNTAGVAGQALQLDGEYDAYLNVKGKSTFLIDGTNRGYVHSPIVYVEDSLYTIQNCTNNASNGGTFTAIRSEINFKDNAVNGLSATNLTISDNSTVICDGNGGYGIAADNVSVDGTSTVQVTNNATMNGFAGFMIRYSGTISKGATVIITGNQCKGLYLLYDSCEVTIEEGVDLTITDNYDSNAGGGIRNQGKNLSLPSNAVIFNNHAANAGDDIYCSRETSTLTFGKVGSDWMLDDCNHTITGWFDDSEGNRWEAHDAPYHAEEFDEFEKLTGMATITGLHTLKAAHGIEPIDPGEPGGGDWDVEHSKSKTATPLDANYESDVTLSLPSAEEQLESDVVFVLDKSTSTDIEDEALAMLEDLKGQIAQTGAKVNVGVVIFNKEANRVLELTELTEENMSRIEEAIRTTMSSGTNTHAGLLAGKAMLDSDTSVDSSRKYLVFVSDAITYMFNSGADYDPTAIAMENGAPVSSGAGTFAGPENWLAKYGDNNEPENWDTWFTQIKAQMEADKDTYYVPYAEQYQNENHISWDERAEHATSVDTALYLTNEVYQSAKNAGYHCYAMKATSNADHPWASRFMDYLANGQEVSFEDIQNDIFYLLDADSSVVDVIGYGTDNAGNEYNFDFVDNLDNLKITVGGNELDKEDIIDPQFNDPYVTSAYGFYDPASGRDGYDFVLKYYQKGQDGNSDECFVWEINVPVSNFAPVQLTYTVKLTNPQTAEGTYGEYDANGKNGSTSLYTNKEATLYPVDSNGDNGVPENFPKPTVSYTVDNGNDNPGTDPTPDPDPDPDRPSRPNRDDDDDWEPLPDAPVKDKPTTEVDVPEETETPTTEQPDKYNPETGDTTTVFAAMALAAVSLGGVVLLGRKKK